MKNTTPKSFLQRDSALDSVVDARLSRLLGNTPEPSVATDLAAKAMRRAARQTSAAPTSTSRWAAVLNVAALIALTVIITMGVQTLRPLLSDSSTAAAESDSIQNELSASSASQLSATEAGEISLFVALIFAVAGGQLVFRGPSVLSPLALRDALGDARLA